MFLVLLSALYAIFSFKDRKTVCYCANNYIDTSFFIRILIYLLLSLPGEETSEKVLGCSCQFLWFYFLSWQIRQSKRTKILENLLIDCDKPNTLVYLVRKPEVILWFLSLKEFGVLLGFELFFSKILKKSPHLWGGLNFTTCMYCFVWLTSHICKVFMEKRFMFTSQMIICFW